MKYGHVHPLSVFLGLLIWLYSSMIGEDAPLEGKKTSDFPSSAAQGPATKLPQKKLSGNDTPQIDTRAFLLSFKRQADESFYQCLQVEFGLQGTIFLSAKLKKNGRLSNAHMVAGTLPQCISSALEKMNFSNLTYHLTTADVVIQWQVEW